MENTNNEIAKLNDLLRGTFLTERIVLSHGVASMPEEEREEIITMLGNLITSQQIMTHTENMTLAVFPSMVKNTFGR